MNQRAYVDQAKVALAENFRPNDPDGSMTAASAAYILKRLVGGFEDAGFFKFKDLLAQMEADGFLTTGTNSKEAFSFRLSSPSASSGVLAFRPHRRLRSGVWYAFVKAEPIGERFFNADTGQVRTQGEETPGDSWIEIPQIDPAKEKQRAEEFIEQNSPSLPGASDALNQSDWYIAFPELLKQHSVQLANNWKRERSTAVVATVEEWRKQHGIAEALIYEAQLAKATRLPSQTNAALRSSGERDPLRIALLNAIAKMSVDELLLVRMPASYLVDELRPDLMK